MDDPRYGTEPPEKIPILSDMPAYPGVTARVLAGTVVAPTSTGSYEDDPASSTILHVRVAAVGFYYILCVYCERVSYVHINTFRTYIMYVGPIPDSAGGADGSHRFTKQCLLLALSSIALIFG